MITVNTRVRSGDTDEAGVVIDIHNGYYIVRMDNGDENAFLESELYPDVDLET